MPFQDEKDAATNIRTILGYDPGHMDMLVQQAIKYVKGDRGYYTVADAIKELL